MIVFCKSGANIVQLYDLQKFTRFSTYCNFFFFTFLGNHKCFCSGNNPFPRTKLQKKILRSGKHIIFRTEYLILRGEGPRDCELFSLYPQLLYLVPFFLGHYKEGNPEFLAAGAQAANGIGEWGFAALVHY